MKKVALHNLGCKVNAYETEVMQQMLEKEGYIIVPFAEEADVYIINTCTVTNMADRKSRQMLHRAKKQNPNAVVIAAGCYVQAAKEELLKDDCIDIVIGNNKKKDLIEILNSYYGETNKEAVIDINKTNEYEELHLKKTSTHTRAIIKVQDGCNQFCSYCIIPYARGRVRSRRLDDVRNEIMNLAEQGYKEVVLTGIHLSSYGVDFEGENINLLTLITDVGMIQGIERIRLGSLEPRIITEEFVRKLSAMDNFCPHFHLSLQSGCNETLNRMNRKYTAEDFLEKCRLIREYFVHPAITTDIIVGFPGETEEEFEQTKAFLNTIRLYETHIFKYSKRNGTKAAVMKGQIIDDIKSVRSNELIQLGDKNATEFRKFYIGKTVSVLFEESVTRNGVVYYSGFTKEYVKVLLAGDENLTNIILKVEIEDILDNEYLLGKRID